MDRFSLLPVEILYEIMSIVEEPKENDETLGYKLKAHPLRHLSQINRLLRQLCQSSIFCSISLNGICEAELLKLLLAKESPARHIKEIAMNRYDQTSHLILHPYSADNLP